MTETEKSLRDFKIEYFRNLDYQYWLLKITALNHKYKRLKDKKKQGHLVIDLLTTYLQSSEILYIAINALIKNDPRSFPDSLFIRSDRLREFVKEQLTADTHLASWFLESVILKPAKDEPDYTERLILYRNFLKECAKDYQDHYELLNAYKHGYRISARHGKGSLGFQSRKGERFPLVEIDSTVHYFTKQKSAIGSQEYSFKIERVFAKSAYIAVLLQNLRAIVLVSMGAGDETKLLNFEVDPKDWQKTFGQYSVNRTLFTLLKKDQAVDDLQSASS